MLIRVTTDRISPLYFNIPGSNERECRTKAFLEAHVHPGDENLNLLVDEHTSVMTAQKLHKIWDKYNIATTDRKAILAELEVPEAREVELVELKLEGEVIEYNTAVFHNGQVMQWRLRDDTRFKCCLTEQQKARLKDLGEAIDYDDCHADGFATINRMIATM